MDQGQTKKKITADEAIKILDNVEDFTNQISGTIDLSRSEKKQLLNGLGKKNNLSGVIKIEYHFNQDETEILPEVTLKGTSAVRMLLEILKK